MGLDMYLKAERYISGYEHGPALERNRFKVLTELCEAEKIVDPETPSCTVSFTAAYWRKANAIHGWFVTNVQDGEDNCADYYVNREQLARLRDLCSDLLIRRNAEEANEKLPPATGFFFGSSEVDRYYWEDLERTVDQLNRALIATAADHEWSFEYHSSW